MPSVSWDFGMVDTDWIAFPVCKAVEEADWSVGALRNEGSYWRQKNWVRWGTSGTINYFTVSAFRSAVHARSRTKGVEEGSENVIAWDATFSTRDGLVERVVELPGETIKLTIKRDSDGHRHTWTVPKDKTVRYCPRSKVGRCQVIAASVRPLLTARHPCSMSFPPGM